MCVCVCLFVFHKVASLLGLCRFWQPATWFVFSVVLHCISIHVVANKLLSLFLVRCKIPTTPRRHMLWELLLLCWQWKANSNRNTWVITWSRNWLAEVILIDIAPAGQRGDIVIVSRLSWSDEMLFIEERMHFCLVVITGDVQLSHNLT